LRDHGLIQKIQQSHRFKVTIKGRSSRLCRFQCHREHIHSKGRMTTFELLIGLHPGGFFPSSPVFKELISCFVLPALMAAITVPNLPGVLRAATGRRFAIAAFGATWGCGSVLFGLGIDALGMTLGLPIMTGLTTALGALIPMAILTPGLLLARNGLLTIAGNLVTIVGVVGSAKAGEGRDRQLGRKVTESILGPRRTFATALTICIASGILSAMFNFGYAFGTPVTQTAVAFGATVDNATNAVWLVMLPAGGIINLAYCLQLARRNRTSIRFFTAPLAIGSVRFPWPPVDRLGDSVRVGSKAKENGHDYAIGQAMRAAEKVAASPRSPSR
jgi:hypothetical protein